MKKLLLLFVMVAALLTGCDPHYEYYYEIKNATQSELTVQIGGRLAPVTIPNGDKKTVAVNGSITDVRDPLDYMASHKLTVMINDKLMSDDFWRKEYWEEKKGNLSYTYTMTLTNELLELLSSENNSANQ